MPIADRLSFTSSSLKGLIIASTFFMFVPPSRPVRTRRPPLLEGLSACKPAHCRSSLRRRACDGLVPTGTGRRQHVRALAVLREVETRELRILVDADATGEHACDAETHERPDDREAVGDEHGDDLREDQAGLA